jgi:hypothetical protein
MVAYSCYFMILVKSIDCNLAEDDGEGANKSKIIPGLKRGDTQVTATGEVLKLRGFISHTREKRNKDEDSCLFPRAVWVLLLR